MNVNKVITKDYENIANWKVRKNKANTKPNKANLLNAQMNVNKVLTKDYENISNLTLCENKPNSKPIQTQSNPISKQLQSFESAKMAQKIDVLKHQNIILEKSNFLYPNRLNSLNQHNPPTGTSFAYLEYMR